MPRRGVVLRSVAVAVAVLLFLFASNHALAQEDEVDAFVEAEVFEPEAIAEMEAFIGQEEAALEPSMMPQFSAFTGEADEQLAESSEVIGPIANPTADPVLGDGEFVIRKTHLHVPGFGVPFEVALTYRSRANHQSSLGFGWSHNYARHIEDILPSGGHDCEGDVVYVTEAMERITFRPVAESYRTGVTSYRPTAGEVPLRLEKHENGPSLYVVTDGSGLSYGFNKVGGRFASLTSVSDTAGNSVTITWDNSISNDDGGIVTRVIDTSGRNFFYNYLKRTRERDPARCGQLGILGFFDDACRTIAVAQLQCVSQQQNDCSAPLVSFQQTVPDNDNEFDLTRVLDADGNGPTFTYLGGFSKAAYVADDMLTPACHLLCDRQNDAPRNWSCHNQDVCTQAIDNAIDTLCRGVANPFVAPRNGYNCSTYCYQACQDPSQTCLADGFDHKSSLNYVSCGEEDDFDPGPDKNFWHTLCECDVASSIGICNSPSPQVQAGIAANQPIGFSNVGSKDECHDVAKDASASVAHTDVCTPFSAACYAKIGNDIRTNNADCSAKCFQDCHENDGALDANGKRRYAFGRPQDLNHDLVEVRDGDGRLVVHNDYGQDPFEIDFDRVVKNRAGDATDSIVTYQYHHLRAEQAIDGGDFQGFFQEVGLSPAEILAEALSLDGGTPVYAVHPDPANVLPLSSFGSVDICNDSCSRPAVQPPITGVMSAGVLQLSSIDPQKSGAVWIGEPLVLKLSGRGIYSILSGPRRELAAGEVLWATASRSGGVRLRATADPNTFAIEGDHSSIATAFGPESKLELRQGVGLSYSAKVPTERLLTARESRRPTPISNRARPAVKTVSGRPPLGLKLPRTTPAPDSLFSTAMARAGFSLGSAPVILERKGNVATFLSPEAGTELAHAQSAKGKISIKATGAARTLALEGPVNTISDHEGRIAIVSLPGGRLAAVPLSAILGERRVDLGLDQAITDGLLTDGMACSVWRHGPPRVGSAATDAQRPEYAVVIHDLHGITRTEYYDKAWRLLRNTNRTTGETIDYNYRNGTLHGVRDAAGTRLCIAADYYGKPLNVTRLPAPGAPGDSQPHVTQYSYTSHGALVDLVKDPGLPSQSAVHRERDTWDRVLWIQNQVGSTSSVRTTYSYDLSPLYNAHSIFPIRIVTPDGTTTSLSYDPNGAGPTQITTEVPGSSPLQLYVRYDALGRVIEQGRNSHWGSIVSHVYDAAGLVTQEAKADALHVGQWLTTTVGYNRSRQRFHEVGPRLERWLTFDPLDHAQIVIEVPSGGGPQKSHCERYSSDGRLDYTIDPEGIVRHNIYDGNNRLARVDLGHPRDLSLWTNACLSGAPAPLPLRPFPQPSPIGTLGRRTSTARAARRPRSKPIWSRATFQPRLSSS